MEEAKVIRPHRHHRSFTSAFILITLGLVFLLNNFGILPWGVWETIWMFWPVLLVIWGLQLVLGSWWLGDLIVGVITLAILAFILLFSLSANNAQVESYLKNRFGWWSNLDMQRATGEIQSRQITIKQDEYPGVTSRTFDADVATGRLIVEDADTTNHLILDSKYYENLGEPELQFGKYDEELGSFSMKLRTVSKSNVWVGSMWRWGNLEYRATLGQKDVSTTLNLSASTGKIEANLDTQKTKDLNIDLGTGSAVINLGEAALPETLKVEAGTGSIEIVLPKGVGLNIRHKIGTGSIKLDGESIKGDGTDSYYSYDTAEKKLNLDLDLGTGSITITTK